jgi:phosphoribosylaminoimidazole-succinocarboxamide synthase
MHEKKEAHLANYKTAQTFILDSTKGETSTYYPITLKDSSVITELKLEAYRQKTRGVNNEYALCFKDSTGVEYKLMFPTDENKGAIAVYDVVSYDSTKLVISFWYYERWGVSNTQLGVLDLSQFIEE